MSSPKQDNYRNLANNVIEKLHLRQMDGFYYESSSEALSAILQMIPEGSAVAYGGSVTLTEIGLLEALRKGNYTVYNRPMTGDGYDEYYKNVVGCDYFLMSSNAITFDGILVNTDGAGNRVAPLIHGPKNVIVVAGMNKLCGTLDSALDRVSNEAAPPNCVRLHRDTPCAKLGRCTDCLTPDSICSHTVITRRSNNPGRIKIVLVGETLGY